MRVRVNIWVGCVGGLVANGDLDTVPGSIYAKKGLKVSFKIIDDWTDGAAALATDNVDVMLTTADVWAKDYAQFKARGFGAHAFLLVDWSRGADGIIAAQGINGLKDLVGQKVAFAPYTPSHFLSVHRAQGVRAHRATTQRDILPGNPHQGWHRAGHALCATKGECRRRLGP